MADKKKRFKNPEILNRKAGHEYAFLKRYEAGIVLNGTEVKALREGMANLTDAFCYFVKDELFVKNMYIAEYSNGTIYNHEARRLRKLLLRNAEIKVLLRRVAEKGLTIVPYRIYFNERGIAKLEVCLAQGKKSFDKRDAIKERDNKREMDRLKKIKL
ncbi:MAG: SsrA-binding protein SmpB [Saprospiraceae bacterium]|nr:SsrA-binding protein SmpB [Saprospiraceae bacterium]